MKLHRFSPALLAAAALLALAPAAWADFWSAPEVLGTGNGQVWMAPAGPGQVVCAWQAPGGIRYRLFDGTVWQPEAPVPGVGAAPVFLANQEGALGFAFADGESLMYVGWDGSGWAAPQLVLETFVSGKLAMSRVGQIGILGCPGPVEHQHMMRSDPAYPMCTHLVTVESYDTFWWDLDPSGAPGEPVTVSESYFEALHFESHYEGWDQWWEELYIYRHLAPGPCQHGRFDDGSILMIAGPPGLWGTNLILEFWYSDMCLCHLDDPYTDWACSDRSGIGSPKEPEADREHPTGGRMVLSQDGYLGANSDEYIRLETGADGVVIAPGSPCQETFAGASHAALTHRPDGDFLLAFRRNGAIETRTTDIERSGWVRQEDAAESAAHALACCPHIVQGYWVGYRSNGDIVVQHTSDYAHPTPAPSPTPTATPVATETPVPSATPETTPTPCPPPGVELIMNQSLFQAGDRFRLRVWCHGGPDPIDLDLYVILDVWGEYWFWPAWDQVPAGGPVTLKPDQMDYFIVLDFAWPEGQHGSADGLLLWGGLTWPGTTDVYGEVDSVAFGYE